MKRFLLGSLMALGLAASATPARADFYFEADCCRHWSMVRTCKQRCWTCTTHCNPLPCISHCASGGSSGVTPWHGAAAYGYPAAAYPAPVAAAPVAPAPAGAPAFKAPAPAPVTKTSATVQQAGYSYYGQAENTGYNYGTGSGYGYYGYGAGYSYAQAPNYWY
ncbi:MAG TPA: hypothetical protein VH592_22975 [Gemmataceae bacterium]